MLPPLHVIAKVTVGAGGAASISVANIDDLVAAWGIDSGKTSRHLVGILNAQGLQAAAEVDVELNFNGDVGAVYNDEQITGVNGVDAAAVANNQNEMTIGNIPAATNTDLWGGGWFLIPHAFNTLNHKVLEAHLGSAELTVVACIGRWASNAAIRSLALTLSAGNFSEGSIFILAVVDERWAMAPEQILSGGDGQFNFADILQGDGDMMSIGYLRSDRNAGNDTLRHTINADVVAANYSRQELHAVNAGTSAAQANNRVIANIPGNTAGANQFGIAVVICTQYAKAINNPHFLIISGFQGPIGDLVVMSTRRNNIEPITSILYEPFNGTNFKDGSGMWLYYLPSRRELIHRKEYIVDEPGFTFRGLDEFNVDFEVLDMLLYGRSDEAAVGDEAQININADVIAANYDFQELTGTGAVVAAARNAASRQIAYIPADNEGANEFGGGEVIAPAYSETDRHKHLLSLSGQQENNVALMSTRHESTDAIESIQYSPVGGSDLLAGTFLELSGVVPLDTVIRRNQDKIAANRDTLTRAQLLHAPGRAWRH